MTTPTCPACGTEATQHTIRDLTPTMREETGTCPRGHLWTARVFMGEEVA